MYVSNGYAKYQPFSVTLFASFLTLEFLWHETIATILLKWIFGLMAQVLLLLSKYGKDFAPIFPNQPTTQEMKFAPSVKGKKVDIEILTDQNGIDVKIVMDLENSNNRCKRKKYMTNIKLKTEIKSIFSLENQLNIISENLQSNNRKYAAEAINNAIDKLNKYISLLRTQFKPNDDNKDQPQNQQKQFILCPKFRRNWKCRIGYKVLCGYTSCHIEPHFITPDFINKDIKK